MLHVSQPAFALLQAFRVASCESSSRGRAEDVPRHDATAACEEGVRAMTAEQLGETGDGFYYAIDTARRDASGEGPVVLWNPGVSSPADDLPVVASDFGTYLRERLANVM